MQTPRIARLLLPVGFAVMLLIIYWAALPAGGNTYAAQLSPAVEDNIPPPPAGGLPEIAWSELVRSLEVNHQARQTDLVDASPSVHLNLTDASLAGSASTLQPVSASVTRDGYLVASGEGLPVPDPAGFFYYFKLAWQPYPCGADYCYPSKLEPGDQIYVSQGSLSQSFSVPLLTALAEPGAAPPGEDSLFGQAPPASNLTAFVIPFADPAAIYTQTATTGGDGSYQIDLSPAHDLHRQDSGYILLEMEPGVSAYRRFVAPMLRAQVGGATISGMAVPQADVILTHTLASGDVLQVIQTSTSNHGGFSHQTEIWDWGDDNRPLAPGDRLLASVGGQAFSMTLPVLTASTHQAAGQISGQAPPGAEVEVRYFDGPKPLEAFLYGVVEAIWDLEPDQQAVTTAAPGGEYTAILPVQTGDYGAAFVTLPDEHQAYARTTTFYLYIGLGEFSDDWTRSLVAGQIDQLLNPITVSVRGPSGYIKDWMAGMTSGAGGFGLYDIGYTGWLKIDSGDVVEIATPGEEPVTFNVPVLTASANRNLSAVFGNAPPNTRLSVSLPYNYPSLTRVVTSTASGAYYADFSSSLEFSYYSQGTVSLSTPEGHQVVRPWRISSCPPYLHGAQVGGNRVFVNIEPNCYDGMMRLWNASGKVKKELYLFEVEYGSGETAELNLYDENGAPIPILPGDRIEIEYGTERTYSTVPQLTAAMDPDTYLISGTAPPGARLEITRRDSEDYWITTIVVTATQDGKYQASLGSQYTYQAGDRIDVAISRQALDFFTRTTLPRLVIPIYSETIYGWLPPLTPYELRATSPDMIASASGYASNDAYLNAYLSSENYEYARIKPGDHLELETPSGVDELTIPQLTARYDVLAARLSGQAPPGAPLEILISGLTQHTNAGADGEYQVEFPELAGVQDVQGTLIYHSPDEHQVTLAFYTPRLYLTLEAVCAFGSAPYPTEAITLTVVSADGSYQRTASQNATWGSVSFCFERGFIAGDQLTLSDTEGVLVQYQVPEITAQHDYSERVLLGRAPPGSKPSVAFDTPVGSITRDPLLEADGSFGIDTSDLPLKIGYSGWVVVGDPLGNLTYRNFNISGYAVHLPLVSLEASR